MAYTLKDETLASVEAFIKKIPDSIVKSLYEKWLAEVRPTGRITGEQMETFVSYAGALPKELQNFPQTFSDMVKNLPEAERREKPEDVPFSYLEKVADESIAHLPDHGDSDNSEETLHKLNTLDGSKGGEPLSEEGEKAAKKKGTKKAAAKKADTKENIKPVREGAKLNPEKKVVKPVVRPVVVNKPIKIKKG